ncbi:MAG: RES domain-containing protein, partial [Steroidobacteraceae bacterium]
SSPFRPRLSEAGEPPSLTQLEQFSQLSLRRWLASAKALTELNTVQFFGLELERQRRSEDLIEAIRASLVPGEPFEKWARIVDYRYCLAPLSIVGSLKDDGGRFNIGAGLNPAAFPAFPALYIAEDYPTASRERFGTDFETVRRDGLAPHELALRTPGSFTHVALRGQLELVLDVGDLSALQRIAAVLREFSLPDRVRQLARRLGMRAPPGLVRTPRALQRQLLHPNWRVLPAQFDLPANSQVFGRIAAAAGAHGIRYPSVRQGNRYCLALFPQNWSATSSFVEVMDGAPSTARLLRIDGTTRALQ